MVIKTFDRTLMFALEATEGTYVTPNATSGYLEVLEPTYTVTPRMYERSPTTMSATPALQYNAGTSKTAPVASVEISFTVEMAGSGTQGTAPRWSALMKACGFQAIDGYDNDGTTANANKVLNYVTYTSDLVAGSSAVNPLFLFNKENLSNSSSTTYDSSARFGRVVGDVAFDDRIVYYILAGGSAPTPDTNWVGEVSTNYAAAQADFANKGVAWYPSSRDNLMGGAGYSSLSMQMVIDDAGTSINVAGCRGNVEFAMTAGDRVLMNFTFTGAMQGYTEGGTFTPLAEGRPIPPAFIGCSLMLSDSSYNVTTESSVSDTVFSTMTLNMGNDVVLRDNPDSSTGYSAAYITGRTPVLTWNPDAALSTQYDWWERFLTGESTRAMISMGSTNGNKFKFKMPALQFTGISDGNRDEVVVLDSTTTLTGGDYGSSVKAGFASTATSGDTQISKRIGTDNELIIYGY